MGTGKHLPFWVCMHLFAKWYLLYSLPHSFFTANYIEVSCRQSTSKKSLRAGFFVFGLDPSEAKINDLKTSKIKFSLRRICSLWCIYILWTVKKVIKCLWPPQFHVQNTLACTPFTSKKGNRKASNASKSLQHRLETTAKNSGPKDLFCISHMYILYSNIYH